MSISPTFLRSIPVTVHLDVNGTIKFGDLASDRNPEQSAQLALAKSTHAVWQENLPSMSYWEYIRKEVCPGDPSTQKQNRDLYLNRFVNWLNETAQSSQETELGSVAERVQLEYNQLLPLLEKGEFFSSFTNAFTKIKEANDSGCQHTVVFRTFGQELSAVERKIHELHPDVSFCRAKYAVKEEGTEQESLELELEETESSTTRETTSDPSRIQRIFNERRYWLVQDCHRFWHKKGHNEQGQYGKPFPFSIDQNRIYTFMDDNAEPAHRAERTIVNPIEISEETIKSVNINDTQGRVVLVDSVQAALNENYFLEQLGKIATAST